MKITFYAGKQTFELLKKRIAGNLRAGEYSLDSRDHKKNESLVVVTLVNRYQGIIPEFKSQLKAMEYKKEIIHLSIEEPESK